MKLLALITDGFGARGGIARYNCDLLGALSQSPAVTEVVALPRTGSAGAALPAKIRQVSATPDRLAWMLHAGRLALSERFDAIFCGHLYSAPLAASLARLTGRPLWLQVHGIEAWSRPGAAGRAAVSQARLVTSVSRHTRRRLLAWSDLPGERVRVLPNTVGDRFHPRPRRADLVARHRLGGRKVVLTVGRLSAAERYKGHDRVLAALPMVAARIPDVTYLIVGSGDDLARLQGLASSAGVADHVVFAGQVSDDEIADYFALADVFAMPSTGEGFGIALVEAARCGLPVIAGNRDGSTDALADGRIGALVDPDDATAIAGAIVAALEGRAGPAAGQADRFAATNFARHVDDLLGQLAHG